MKIRYLFLIGLMTIVLAGFVQTTRAQGGNRVRFWIKCPANQEATIHIYTDPYPWPEIYFELPSREGPMNPEAVQPKTIDPHGNKGIDSLDYRFTARFSDGHSETHYLYYRYPNGCSPSSPAPQPTAIPPTAPPPPPQVSFFVNPNSITEGECATVTWNVIYATSVRFDGQQVGANDTRSVCPNSTTNYSLNWNSSYGQDSRTVTLTVFPRPTSIPPAQISFDASPKTIYGGECVTVSWTTRFVSAVYYNGALAPENGTRTECPTSTTTYLLQVQAPSGNQNKSVMITVLERPTDVSPPTSTETPTATFTTIPLPSETPTPTATVSPTPDVIVGTTPASSTPAPVTPFATSTPPPRVTGGGNSDGLFLALGILAFVLIAAVVLVFVLRSQAQQTQSGQVQVMGSYNIIRPIGSGGQGSLFLAQHRALGKVVVIKKSDGGDAAQFQQEANLLANLRHPNLPAVTDFFVEANGTRCLVMDYVEGQNLEKTIEQHGALAENVALSMLRPIFEAVKYLHANRVIHRDIKPANIIITPQASAVLVDFGIAKALATGQLTRTGARGYGTPGYAPPEQYSGGTTERSDVYALGATLYYMLIGRVPVESTMRAAGTPLIPPRQIIPTISPRTENAILLAMSLSAAQRYASVLFFEQALY